MVEIGMTFYSYRDRVDELYSKINEASIMGLLNAIQNVVTNKGSIYILGNGGSASTASHFATDLNNIAYKRGLKLKAFSLVDNVSIITSVGNDLSFENIFVVQLQSKLTAGDLVLCISASGNSINLVNAVNYSNKIGAKTASLLGFDGGFLKNISSISCHVPSRINEYGPVEDIHLSICHYLASSINGYYET